MVRGSVVSSEQWLAKRKELLAKEKELTRLRDQVSVMRRELPWTRVDKEYVFAGVDGPVTLSNLFDGRSQLIVYHFMFQPDWTEGCKSCSLIADSYAPSIIHLNHRDVSLVTVSRVAIERIESFRMRMGWTFTWVSSLNSDFNCDFNVSFTEAQQESRQIPYNYELMPFFPSSEGPGLSVFYKDESGALFHTYSTFARGLDALINAYQLLDLVPKGRDEDGLVYGMEWVRHRDRYDDQSFVDQYLEILSKSQP